MKVMCINDKWRIDQKTCNDVNIKTPLFSNIYTVINEGKDWLLQECFELAEFPGYWVVKKFFAPLPNIDEMEIVNQREQELVIL